MYCKYCGKELKEGARFCDRCGQSVRKTLESEQAAKHREIEELKAERLNRKKRLEEKEARQKDVKNKGRGRHGGVIIFVFVAVFLAILSVIVGYSMISSDSGTSMARQTATPSASANASPTPLPTAEAEKYSQITVGNISIPYPTNFYTNTTSGNVQLDLLDKLGGATMKVTKEVRTGEITDLMKEYITSIGAEGNPEMRAGSDWYMATAEVDGKVYHRKCIVRNNLAVYYDFVYDSTSTTKKKYNDYISYIDSNFK